MGSYSNLECTGLAVRVPSHARQQRLEADEDKAAKSIGISMSWWAGWHAALSRRRVAFFRGWKDREYKANMLRNAKDLQGLTIRAKESEIGAVEQFSFDDETWAIRYVRVNTEAGLTAGSF
jgi:hypothetical protein